MIGTRVLEVTAMFCAWGRRLIPVLLLALQLCLAQQPAEIRFHHLSITVPPDTFNALSQSQFLRQDFAGFEAHTNIIDGGTRSYSSVNIYGQQSYVQFVCASPSDPAGMIGFGMSVEDRNQIPALRKRLERDLKTPVAMNLRSRRVGHADLPWFDYIAADWIPRSKLAVWTAAYYPDYFVAIDAPLASKAAEDDSAAHFVRGRYMKNIRRVVLWQNQANIKAMVTLMLSLGWDLYETDKVLTIRGSGMEFVLVPLKTKEEPHLEIDFELNREYHSTLSYGFPDGSELMFATRIARWSFPSPRKADSLQLAKNPVKSPKK